MPQSDRVERWRIATGMTQTMRQFELAAHPRGRPLADTDFSLVEVPIPVPAPGEALFRLRWLGFDPAQKGWMENFADYVAPMAIGDVMRGTAIGEVVASDDPALPVGSLHHGMMGWSEYWTGSAKGLAPVEPALPPTAFAVAARAYGDDCVARPVRDRPTDRGRYGGRLGRGGGDRIAGRPTRPDRRVPHDRHRRRRRQVPLADRTGRLRCGDRLQGGQRPQAAARSGAGRRPDRLRTMSAGRYWTRCSR